MKIFLVGGFLGSGKTTAIRHATLYLRKAGKKTGVITNDQGEQLVDTRFILQQDMVVEEVTNGCFCCHFEDLSKSINALQQLGQTDIIFAESVGSCTDLVATVVKPLLEYEKNMDPVLSVFADVRLLCSYLLKDKDIFYGKMNYVYEKQLEEADLLVISKIDTVNEEQLLVARKLIESEYGHKKILYQNSLVGGDIERWLTAADQISARASRQSLEINYEDYAAGEAEMAWYDSELEIVCRDTTAGNIGFRLMEGINKRLRNLKSVIGHLKFLMSDEKQHVKVSFTTIPEVESFQAPGFGKTNRVGVLINARVKADPAFLEKVIAEAIREIEQRGDCTVKERNRTSFKPGYPRPTHRIGN